MIPTALHQLPATSHTVHWGYFDASLAPTLRVRSGDLIRAEAITHHAGDAPELMMDADIRALYAAIPEQRPRARRAYHDRSDPCRGRHTGRHARGALYRNGAAPSLRVQPRRTLGYLYREMAERE